ncbi:hypothetical protein J6590_010972 [Homalodisca vitripennis]|nr:hypothetical protein J6590_010972 [Homalodisca vitripennis]
MCLPSIAPTHPGNIQSIPDEESEGVAIESDAAHTDYNSTGNIIKAHSSTAMGPPEHPKKRYRKTPQPDPPSTDISQAIQKLDKISHNVTEDKQYEQFGRYVAAELRQLPKREAILLQQEIQDCITRSKLSLLDNEQEFHDFTFMQSPNVDALTSTTTSSNEEEDVLQTAMINTFGKLN